MVGQLLALPLRLGARGTQIVLQAVEGVAGRAAIGALQAAGAIRRGDSASTGEQARRPSRSEENAAAQAPSTVESAPPAAGPARGRSEPAPIVSAPEPEDVERPIAPEPVHVSEEPELVREEAEPGAEDGAGATVNIHPPWDGYEHMGARQVIDRLGDASPAELAAVQLYESSNRSRQTVLEAVERRLKAANGRG
jgi:hypothetical protein